MLFELRPQLDRIPAQVPNGLDIDRLATFVVIIDKLKVLHDSLPAVFFFHIPQFRDDSVTSRVLFQALLHVPDSIYPTVERLRAIFLIGEDETVDVLFPCLLSPDYLILAHGNACLISAHTCSDVHHLSGSSISRSASSSSAFNSIMV